jgi:flavodoxin short chain
MMAGAVIEGAKSTGAEAVLFTSAEFRQDMVPEYDAIAFGCPSMGAEQLEETEFEPMFSSCADKLNGKKISLFGSYGWGDGMWMRDWEKTCLKHGALLVSDSVICVETPDEAAADACRALGKALANAAQ